MTGPIRLAGPPTDRSTATGHRRRWLRAGWLALVLALAVLCTVAVSPAPAAADPTPAPTPSGVSTADCAAKLPGQVAWCMPWAVHVDKPPAHVKSHCVTYCSRASTAADEQSCIAASIDPAVVRPPADGTPSVLMDGPTTGSGLAGQINCALMQPVSGSADTDRIWAAKKSQCQQDTSTWVAQGFDPDPKPPDCPATDVSCKIARTAQAGVRSGVQGLVDLSVQGMVYLLSWLAKKVFTATSIGDPDAVFYTVYDQLAGVMVLLVIVFFLISTIINGLRTSAGPSPIATLGGLVRAILGITLAGGIAYTISLAWDQATNAVITQNANTAWDPGAVTRALTNLAGGTGAVGTELIALVLSLFGSIGLLLLLIVMLFRSVLFAGAAFFGAVAMSGQTMGETRHWGRRWFWTTNALASSKFFIAELWIYGSRSAYSGDDLSTVLRSILLIWLMVVAPWILLRLTSLWDGYLSDVNAYGVLTSGGSPAEMGSAFADGARQGGQDAAARFSGGGSNAAEMADAGTAETPVTPGGAADDAAALDDAAGAQTGEAASTGGDGGPVGEPTAAQTPTGTGWPDSEQGSGQPNADEADAMQQDGETAQQDLAAGTLTPPGQAPGDGAGVPLQPQAAAGADPTGVHTPTGTGWPDADPAPGGAQAGGDATSGPSSQAAGQASTAEGAAETAAKIAPLAGA
jgi:hypothetical protein